MQRNDESAKPKADNATLRAVRLRKRLALGPILAVAAVTLLLALTPLSQAATVRHGTFAPPYGGKGLVSVTLGTVGCGAKDLLTVYPKFTPSTGIASGATKAKSVSCSSPLGYNSAKGGFSSGYFSKPFTGLSGLHHVVVHWTVSWNSTITAKLGPRFSGFATASSFIVATLYLLDETNLTYLPPSTSWSWFSTTSNGTVHNSSTVFFAMYLNQTLVSSHSYTITPAINVAEYASASSAGPTSASAYLSLTGPTSTKLTSVTLV
jgi:hypothetical protein